MEMNMWWHFYDKVSTDCKEKYYGTKMTVTEVGGQWILLPEQSSLKFLPA